MNYEIKLDDFDEILSAVNIPCAHAEIYPIVDCQENVIVGWHCACGLNRTRISDIPKE